MTIGLKWMGCLVAMAFAATSTEGALLRRELKAGTLDEYEVKCTQTTVPGEGVPGDPHTVKISWNASYRVGEREGDKGAALTFDATDFTFTAEGAHLSETPEKTRKAKGNLDERGRILAKTSDKAATGTNLQWLLTDFVELPEKEVAVGDTWDVTLPSSIPLGTSKIVLPAKLAGDETYEGRPAWVITLEKKRVPTENKVQIRLGPTGETRDAKFVGKADVSIRALIEKSSGRVLQMTSKVHADQELVMPDAPAPTPSSIDYTSTMKLKLPKI